MALQARTPDASPGTFCLIPVIDVDFLPERPLDAFRHGTAHRVPLIIGTKEREGSLFRSRVDILPKSPTRIAAIFDHAPVSPHDAMRSVYASLPAKQSSSDCGGDFVFWYPSLQIGDFHSRVAPVSTYRFDLAPRLMHMLGIGATHGIELFALFDHVDGPTAPRPHGSGHDPARRAGTLHQRGRTDAPALASLRLHKAARRHLADLLGNRPADSETRSIASNRIREESGGRSGRSSCRTSSG